MRYPRVGGRRERHFAGTSFEPRKLPENAATPTSRVHAVLGSDCHFMNSIIKLGIMPTTTGRKTDEKNLIKLAILKGQMGNRAAIL